MDWNFRRWQVSGWSLFVAGALAATTASSSSAGIVEVSGCDTVVTATDARRYRLVADADCLERGGQVLAIPDGGILELRDHTLRAVAVHCTGSCRVVGPGTIDGGGVVGAGRVVLRRVTVVGSPADGVVVTDATGKGRVTIIDSTIADSAGNGVEFDRRATIVRSRVSGNGQHGVAVSTHTGNDCARGRLSAKASTFADNGRDGDCGAAEVCADIATCTAREAKLSASSCDRSRQLGSGLPGSTCGVCDFD